MAFMVAHRAEHVGNERLIQAQDWENLADTYQPQYFNKVHRRLHLLYNREGKFLAVASSYAYKEANELLVYLLVLPLLIGITLFTGVTTTPATISSNDKQPNLNGYAHLASICTTSIPDKYP
nr:hypothetical protein [Tanacetum cinerariifolium]